MALEINEKSAQDEKCMWAAKEACVCLASQSRTLGLSMWLSPDTLSPLSHQTFESRASSLDDIPAAVAGLIEMLKVNNVDTVIELPLPVSCVVSRVRNRRLGLSVRCVLEDGVYVLGIAGIPNSRERRPGIWYSALRREWWMEPADRRASIAKLNDVEDAIHVTNAYDVLAPGFVAQLTREAGR